MTSIWWIRRDLRLEDQPTLHMALASGPVIPLFIMDPALSRGSALPRQAFLFEGLQALSNDLRQRGSQLVVRSGNPVHVLSGFLAETSASAVYAEQDFTPYARRRDERVAREVEIQLVSGQTVFHPSQLCKADGTPCLVFAPFARAWKSRLPGRLHLLPAPGRIDSPPGIPSEPVPDLAGRPEFPAGEAEAQRRLQQFLQTRIAMYASQRDQLGISGTSALSPYLRFGMLSMKTAAAAALEAMETAPNTAARHGAEKWLDELIWREFYIGIMYHFPHVRAAAFQRRLAGIRWRNDPQEFDAWKSGHTGVPVVDAAMRQLRQTGWIHNRARMIAASYLVKDLLVNWQWGEGWFMQNLVDGDPASNNGGWQWIAGTGTDAAPYFRIFNPVLQSRKFDLHGNYIRRWVPELAGLPDDVIHAPWEKGVRAAGYPAKPLVEHAKAIARMRLAYEHARDTYRQKEQDE